MAMAYDLKKNASQDSTVKIKSRALSQNVTNGPEGALTQNLKYVEVTVQNKFHYCRIYFGQISSMKINKEPQLQKYDA